MDTIFYKIKEYLNSLNLECLEVQQNDFKNNVTGYVFFEYGKSHYMCDYDFFIFHLEHKSSFHELMKDSIQQFNLEF